MISRGFEDSAPGAFSLGPSGFLVVASMEKENAVQPLKGEVFDIMGAVLFLRSIP
jgi:hypothetical protein